MFYRAAGVALLLLSCGAGKCAAQFNPEFCTIISPEHGVVRPLDQGDGLVYVGVGSAPDTFSFAVNDASGVSWIQVDVDPLLNAQYVACVTWDGPVVTGLTSYSLLGSSKSSGSSKTSQPPTTSAPAVISEPASTSDPADEDGYVVIVSVDQPGEGGDRDPWEGWILSPDVGHAYIEIVNGNTGESQSAGLHPSHFVTPVNSTSPGVIQDDSGYHPDVQYEIPISREQFDELNAIIASDRLDPPTYDLNDHNCTDYVIDVLDQVGIPIESRTGTWPGGSGHNPGDLGEDLVNQGGIRTEAAPGGAGPSP